MHNEATTDRMIKSFLARKAEEFPEVFDDIIPNPTPRIHAHLHASDIVTR